jgi:hypothetical protein
MVLNNITSHCRAVNSAGCDVNKEKGVRAFLFFFLIKIKAHTYTERQKQKEKS